MTSERIYTGFLILAAVLIIWAIYQFHLTKKLLSTGIITRATVIELVESHSDDGTTYAPIFEFRNGSNRMVSHKSSVSSSPPSYIVGQTVLIVFESMDDSNYKVISYWGLYRWTIILLLIASPMLIICGGWFLYNRFQ